MKITVLGAGAWGTALAIALAKRHEVLLWGRDAAALHAMQRDRENKPYLPGFALPPNLQCSPDFDAALAHAAAPPSNAGAAAHTDTLLIAASSVSGLRAIGDRIAAHALRPDVPNLIWLCKGLEQDTHLLPHQIVREVLGDRIPAGALSGPSFAQEVARGLPCALTFAGTDAGLAELVVEALHGERLRIYSSDDLIGVEVGGAVKNILAIATGAADGLALGLNARAALITRGLAEITRFGVALGARAETFTGLSGMGDLILTCTGDLSRNRKVGLGLAQGKPLQQIETELGHVAEGVRCARAVRALAQKHGVEMPISDAVASALFDGLPVEEMVTRLLAREPREENHRA
ncbi:NAD(P)-dependent glycerol-3-phosphate dehydrogenase [Oxalobacteraceae bacterium CAVE-383]|nr:NAD(P)-dependent glycerol-3-phosphate dehydrogenase [Oxalobacteraceae bacterium CAVE-383]